MLSQNNDDLAIPAFLKRERGEVQKKFRSPRWKRLPAAERPEGERWLNATRWEVTLQDEVSQLACGRRRLWVVEGRKWARLHDGVKTIKVPMSVWGVLARNATEVK